jgi:hypothetical protein
MNHLNIVDNHSLLTPQQAVLLNDSASRSFEFGELGEFKSIDDILSSLEVKVVIEPGIVKADTPDSLLNTVEYWRKEMEAARKSDDVEYRRMASDIFEAIFREEENFSHELRGLYDPKDKVIRLYPDEMKTEYGGNRMDELLVSTLAHEAMHAYFDRPGHEMFPYLYFVEEPLAEFGMLLYLKETGSEYYDWAHKDVADKKSCYRFGADLMTQHLNQGAESTPQRKSLETYKYDISDTSVVRRSWGVTKPIVPWQNVFNVPPRYYLDKANGTLYLDGDWGHFYKHVPHDGIIDIHIHIDSYSSGPGSLCSVHLGDNFGTGHWGLVGLLSECPVTVSPKNKQFTSRNGVPVFKNSGEPALHRIGKIDKVKLYEICRDGKWGVIDANLNQIIPCKYDRIGSFDGNDLIRVRIYDRYGLVNLQGEEQVPVKYDDITRNRDNNTYTVKKGGREFEIDKFGNEIH